MAGPARVICPSGDLTDGGDGVRFASVEGAAGPVPAFVVRFDGAVRAFVNRCPHLGTELDWVPGRFFDDEGLYLICATHGAAFDAVSGLCVAGPCRGARLEAIPVAEMGGIVIAADGGPPAGPCPDKNNP